MIKNDPIDENIILNHNEKALINSMTGFIPGFFEPERIQQLGLVGWQGRQQYQSND